MLRAVQWRNNFNIPNLSEERPASGEVTIGTLVLKPQEQDNNKFLKCQASNPSIDKSEISEKTKLNVHYPPNVTLELGSKLNPSEIKQGDDVYFECRIKANPEPYKVSWFKDKKEIHKNVSGGVLVTGKSLVLQKVLRRTAGEYVCEATNTQGTQVSNSVRLEVMFPPECLTDEPSVLAVGRGETVNITCRVASNPLKAMFHWHLNGSERSFYSPGRNSSFPGQLTSHYNFVGTKDKDYGALLCWANNTVGVQKKACVFNIIPAGPPAAPDSCQILNHTAENIEVSCEGGFDGGLAQSFLAEVYDESLELHLNLTSQEPQFSVESRPDTAYIIRVTAFNDKGRSSPVSLNAYKLKVAEKRMGETKSLFDSPLILTFLIILGGFVLIVVVLVLVTRWRRNYSALARVPANPRTNEPIKTSQENPKGESPSSTTIIDTKSSKSVTPMGSLTPVETISEKPKAKPKKQVMVLENGKIERPGIGSSSPDNLGARNSLISRERDEGFLPNGSAGYYNSLGKSSIAGSSGGNHGHIPKSQSYSSSSYTPLSSSSSHNTGGNTHPHLPPVQPYTRTLPAQPIPQSRLGALSPLIEEYTPQPSYHHHYSSLPRNRSPHGHYLRDEAPMGRFGARASVEDRYHLMHEWRENPRYLIRTRDRIIDDESFV